MSDDLKKRLARFAAEKVRTRPDLLISEAFPFDIWEGLGKEGLMGLAIDPAYGGLGLSFAELSKATEDFAAAAGCPGMVMSWLGHNLMGRMLVQNIGTEAQKDEWLPRVASGAVTACVAISEPGAGAHPKHLTTSATRDGEDYLISGEKAFVTNGPIAGLLTLLAITDEKDGRKEFTAFLVPGDSDGITVRPMDKPKIDFLKPSPHGLISFDNVRVPEGNILGPLGDGFDVVSKRVRSVEDAVGLGGTAGNLRAQLTLLGEGLTEAEREDPEILEFFGAMLPRLAGLSTLAHQAALAIDEGRPPTVGGAAGALMGEAQRAIGALLDEKQLSTTEHFQRFHRDMSKSGNIARTARKLMAQKAGKAWLDDVRAQAD